MDAQQLLSPHDVAERLGIDRTTVHRRRLAGKLHPVMKVPGKNGAYLFDADYIDSLAREDARAS